MATSQILKEYEDLRTEQWKAMASELGLDPTVFLKYCGKALYQMQSAGEQRIDPPRVASSALYFMNKDGIPVPSCKKCGSKTCGVECVNDRPTMGARW